MLLLHRPSASERIARGPPLPLPPPLLHLAASSQRAVAQLLALLRVLCRCRSVLAA